MITSDNFRELVIMLDKKDLKKMLETNSDYMKLEVSFSNCCVWANIKGVRYTRKTEKEMQDKGSLFCDKDTFLQMCKEVDIDIEAIAYSK